MSRINFANLTSERPDLKDVWSSLSEWMTAHPSVNTIEPHVIASQMRKPVDPWMIATAMQVLVDSGDARRVFKVEDPQGCLVGPDFNSPLDVPEEMPGRFGDNWFRTDDGRIVVVFRVKEK